ncbi:PREDICTED: uncharacterized protein LOC109354005 [Lupinus angustifolius]|uniref:uncharacterized protein LOC109354005 n=1 Tax=Lupinus angustifolius TaxID=3871 RepID=UPI00092FA798|nr:PREDICTED: uncharacterized protein LOC109354005 [Lupinus angustifolius]
MAQPIANFSTNLPVLDGSNWSKWSIQMKAIFCYQDVAEIVEDGFSILEEGATEVQKSKYKQSKRKDCKALCIIHQAVDNAHFEKIAGSATSKEAWETLEKHYDGAAQLKKIRLQTMRRRYELMQMEESEKISEYFTRVITHTNSMKSCGEKMDDATIVEKILRIVTPRFDHVVVAIEELGKVERMKVEELQGSLEAHEQRMNEMGADRFPHQALYAQTFKKGSQFVKTFNKNRGKSFEQRNGPRKFPQSGNDLNTEHGETFNRRDGGKQVKAWKKKLDRKRIRCFNCDKLGHFSSECQAPNKNHQYGRQESEANLVKEDDEDSGEIDVQLMMTTSNLNAGSDTWYLDSGCSNHMTGNRDWLVNFDATRKSKVKFDDHRIITAEGTGDVPLIMANGRKAYISDVLFVPNMKTNLISIGQLHEKGLTMQLLNGFMTIYDDHKRKILNAPLTNNRTFQVKLGARNTQCLNATNKNDETRSCGEKMDDTTIVEKILRMVTPRFDHVVVAIEDSGKVERMKVEELQGSLEAHEQRMNPFLNV